MEDNRKNFLVCRCSKDFEQNTLTTTTTTTTTTKMMIKRDSVNRVAILTILSKVRLAIRKRNRFLSLHNKNPTQISWERYRFQRNQTNYLIQTLKKNYFRKLNFDLCDSSVSNKNGGH